MEYVEEHLRILSGFYGILKPFDGVTPYRLEMQAKLAVNGHKDLYCFWGRRLYDHLLDADRVVVNLASKEYAKCIEPYLTPQDRFLTVRFVYLTKGKARQKATAAKMAQGEMVRFMAENQICSLERIKEFQGMGFAYAKELSDQTTYVLHRGYKMKEISQKYGSLLIQNRDVIREVFPWESGQICLASAIIYTMKGKLANEKLLRESKKLITQKVGAFSSFRGKVRVPTAAMVAASEDLEGTMDHGLLVYELLKKEFWQSSYLPMAAMMIAQMTEKERYEEMAARTRRLYERMRKEHPFLTSSEDSPFCAMLALSDHSDDRLIEDMEKCYRMLKEKFLYGNAVQSLSHVLALFDEPAEVKCEKTMHLYQSLREAGGKYGTQYELPSLGVLAMTNVPVKEIVQEMMEIDAWLAEQKGFGFWGGITAKQRMMYAGMLAQKDYIEELPLQTSALGGTIAMLIAQETALCAVVIMSIMATSANSSSS